MKWAASDVEFLLMCYQAIAVSIRSREPLAEMPELLGLTLNKRHMTHCMAAVLCYLSSASPSSGIPIPVAAQWLRTKSVCFATR